MHKIVLALALAIAPTQRVSAGPPRFLTTISAAAIALAAVTATPAMAFYTECTVSKDTELATRPNGPTEPRYAPVNKGDKVAFRGSYHDWWFVMHAKEGGEDYGWLPRNVLTNCQKQEGTP
jgi:hypothetical protein